MAFFGLLPTYLLLLVASSGVLAKAQLDPYFYDKVCPQALPTIKSIIEDAVKQEARMGASLLRLHFHDCFVNGCDGSILLDDTPTFIGEKNAAPNMNSARGFEVIDRIKSAVNYVCKGNIVSCADIVAVAARDSVVALGGPSYQVQLGRRDARSASQAAANNSIPAPTFDFSRLLSNFASHGLTMQDLVVLSGAHTLGFARCTSFRDRLYNESCTLDASFASSLKSICPLQSGNGDDNLSPLDATPAKFDTVYYDWLLQRKGLLHSDQQLYKGDGSGSDGLVKFYSTNAGAFWEDFGGAMLRMGSLSPLTGSNGEIRMDCRKGCDGSVLLDDTAIMTGEKTAKPNNNSLRGFEVIDDIKSSLNDVCQGNVVSCADILAVAARYSIAALGGSSYDVLLGRRDATSASLDAANANIPAPIFNKSQLLSNFDSQGLSMQDLVVLSGAHTLGFARCTIFRNRIYNDANIDPAYAASLESVCPISGDDDVLVSLDDTPTSVDTDYYQGLIQNRGLLGSDQQLFQGDSSDTDNLVQYYSDNPDNFWSDFGTSMINMGNISPLTGDDGEIRENCRVVN